ncbi:MAG: PAS domain-containing protein, partial [Pseudomonadota bacterium]
MMIAKHRESEALFHQLFLHMGQGVVIQEADGRIVDANPAAERILGLNLDQMRGVSSLDPSWRTVHEDGTEFSGPEHPAMVALRSGLPVIGVVMGVFHPGDQDWRWIRIDAHPRHDPESGAVRQVFTVFSDITEMRRAYLEMRQARKFLADVMVAASEVSIIATDQNGLITTFNLGAERLLGYSAGEMVGKQTPAILHRFDEVVARGQQLSANLGRPVEGFRVFVEMAEQHGSEKREWIYLHQDGHSIPVSLVVTTMRNDAGEI